MQKMRLEFKNLNVPWGNAPVFQKTEYQRRTLGLLKFKLQPDWQFITLKKNLKIFMVLQKG